MSKLSKTHLTGSRKSVRRKGAPGKRAVCPDVTWVDAMSYHCRQLGTLVELLEGCRDVDGRMVEGIGTVLRRDVTAMQTLLDQLDKPQEDPAA